LKNIKYISIIIIISLLSCSKRGLITPADDILSSVEVIFDWSNYPAWEEPLDSVTIYFYGEDGRVFHKTGDTKEFKWELPVQRYKVIAINRLASGVLYGNLDNFERANAMAHLTTKSESYVEQHRRVIFASFQNLTVLANGSSVLTLEPRLLSKKIEYKIIFSGDPKLITNCTAIINGVIKGVYLSNGEYIVNDNYCGKLSTEFNDENRYFAEIYVFGINANIKDNIALFFKYNNGTEQILDIDISEAFKDFVVTKKITLYIDITLATEGNFSAKLKSWVATEEEINLE
jgi:hypothetical protein